jgi:hypothetical protein
MVTRDRTNSVCVWPLWVGLIALTGCAEIPPNGTEAYPAQRALIGKTKEALLACAGPPVTERVTGDHVQFIYYREASQLEESFPGSKSSFARLHHGCRATIVLREDRVNEVRYESDPSSYHDEDHCEDIFEPCVSP